MQLVITSCIAMLGAYLGQKLRIPAGALLGAMFLTAAFNVATGLAYIPPDFKFYTQIATGAYVGAKITKADISNLKDIVKPAMILMAVMLAFSIGVSLLIYSISDLSIATAMFSMAPAGVSDMALAAMDFDAEPSVVAFMQTVRIIFILSLIPPIIKAVDRHQAKKGTGKKAHYQKKTITPSKKTWKDLLLTGVISLLPGSIGKYLGVPSGAIIFSMIGCITLNILTGRGYMPLRLRQFIQIFAGALIGCSVGREQLGQISQLKGVIFIGIISFILLDLVAAALITRFTEMDLITALFSCAPAGLTDLTTDFGGYGGR